MIFMQQPTLGVATAYWKNDTSTFSPIEALICTLQSSMHYTSTGAELGLILRGANKNLYNHRRKQIYTLYLGWLGHKSI